jgi:hypothetical protein
VSDGSRRPPSTVDGRRASETSNGGFRRRGPFDPRVWRVATVELRRSRRRLADDVAALAALALLALGAAGTAAGLTALTLLPETVFERALLAVDASSGVRGVTADGTTLARAAAAAVWVGLTGAVVSRTASVTARPDGSDGLLLAVSPGRAVVGVIGAEWLRAAGVLGPAVVLSTLTAGRLAGTATAATVGLAGALLLTSTVAAGYPLGLGLKATVEAARRRGVGWTRLLLTAMLVVVAGVSTLALVDAPPLAPLATAADLPPGGLADLALSPVGDRVGVGAVGRRAAAGVGWAVLSLVAGLAASSRLATWLWLVEPPRSAALEHPSGLDRVPAPPESRAVRSVVQVVWLRTARAPVKLVYTLYPIGGVIALWVDPSARARIVASLYVYLPLYAAWASGAGMGLNPLGDEGASLPVVLCAVRGRAFVRGHLLATAIPGAALGSVAALVAPLVGALPALAAPVGVVAATAFAALSAAVAVAVGSAFPGFDEIRVAASTRIVVPSFAASIVYFVTLALLSAPGTLALLAVADLPTPLPESGLVVAGALAAQVAVATGAVWVGGRSAAARFDRFRV